MYGYYLLNAINAKVTLFVSYVFTAKWMNDFDEIWYGENWNHKKGYAFKKKNNIVCIV